MFYIDQIGYTCKGILQGRNPKLKLLLQLKTIKLKSIILDHYINKQLNYYRLVTVLTAIYVQIQFKDITIHTCNNINLKQVK